MVRKCRDAAPACTDNDIVAAINEIGATITPNIQNPIGWILKNTPHCFSSGSYSPQKTTQKTDKALEFMKSFGRSAREGEK